MAYGDIAEQWWQWNSSDLEELRRCEDDQHEWAWDLCNECVEVCLACGAEREVQEKQ